MGLEAGCGVARLAARWLTACSHATAPRPIEGRRH